MRGFLSNFCPGGENNRSGSGRGSGSSGRGSGSSSSGSSILFDLINWPRKKII